MRIASHKSLLKLQGRFYVVQFSDSLYLISQRFGVSVSDLLTYNDQLQGSSTLFPGEILYIPEPMSNTLRRGTEKHQSKHLSKHISKHLSKPGSGRHQSKQHGSKKRLSRP
ncbi:LysM peptidoglycan-binding domain-containing protein [Paenibacillus rigui]|uniref:LysM peptidoglycan-binding domain-containing protein n=1 Tax=Paenibacillus rigui TaxID=554312 RepID=UPI0015C663FB|nr:LysM domain-containing protein [Paenibacillus rigui]